MILRASLIVLLILASCTVTKRVHNPGFHVEWHKNYSKDLGSDKDEKLKNDAEEQEILEKDEIIDSLTNSSIQSPEVQVSVPVERSKEPNDLLKDDVDQLSENGETSETSDQESTTNQSKISKKKRAARGDGTGMEALGAIGAGLAILGAVLLIGSLFLFFGFAGFGGLFNVLVLSGNGFAVGLLGFILFLIILVVVILFVAIVEFILGGYQLGFILGGILLGLGLLLMLISQLGSS